MEKDGVRHPPAPDAEVRHPSALSLLNSLASPTVRSHIVFVSDDQTLGNAASNTFGKATHLSYPQLMKSSDTRALFSTCTHVWIELLVGSKYRSIKIDNIHEALRNLFLDK